MGSHWNTDTLGIETTGPPFQDHFSPLLVSASEKNSAVVFRKFAFNEPLKPSFRIPSSFSHSTLKDRKPQILAKGFSRKLKVGLRSSCSTLSRRSSGATRYRLMSRFGCNANRSLIRNKPE